MTVGSKIKSLRKKRGLTQAALADGIVSRGMLSQIENGLANPSMQTLSRLADRLSVSPAFLFDESGTLPRLEWNHVSEQIAEALHKEDYASCLSVLTDAGLQSSNAASDLYVFCHLQLAVENFYRGDYTAAKKELDFAEPYLSNQTMAKLLFTEEKVRFLRLMMENTENPDILTAAAPDKPDFLFPPALFFTALKWLANGRKDAAEALLTCGALPRPYADYVHAKIAFHDRNYVETLLTLKQLGAVNDCPLFLSVLGTAALEECCRICEDYKGAYENQLRYRELLAKIR